MSLPLRSTRASPFYRSVAVALLLILVAAGSSFYSFSSKQLPQRTQSSTTPQQTTTIATRVEQEVPHHSEALHREVSPAPTWKTISIEFPDGTTVKVTPRPLRVPSIARPTRLADVYEQLRTLAEAGDWSASYGLHRWLAECGRAFNDEVSLESAIDKLNKEGVLTIPSDPPKRIEKVTPSATLEGALRQAFRFCEGITPEQRAEASHWQELSVESGEVYALREEAQEMRRVSPEHYFELSKSLWRDYGDISALPTLARIYRHGIAGGEPDYISTYAYQLIEFKIMEAVYSGSAYPSHRNMLRAMEESLSYTASYLTPEQTLQAVRLSSQLLAANTRCCTGYQFGTWH